jgi:hypothetical protein
MRKILVILICLFSFNGFSQVNENFNDGNFTSNPVWTGQTAYFHINTQQQLQTLISSVSDTIYLTTASHYSLNASWEFYIQLNFDPSSGNQLRIYLQSDKENLQSNLNGYFLQVGESGTSDSYDLYEQTGNTISKIIDGAPRPRTYTDTLQALIKITRDEKGDWELFTNTDSSGYQSEGTTTDLTYVSSSYFGVLAKYTSSRSDKFIFDDLHIHILSPDTIPPKLISVMVSDSLHLDLHFNEHIDSASALNNFNFFIDHNIGNPVIAERDPVTKNSIHLTLPQKLMDGDYLITCNNIQDTTGNISTIDSAHFYYQAPFILKRNDIIINEIFADPSPHVELPEAEFIELYNKRNKIISLKGWKYTDGSSTYTFGDKVIYPDEYLILCAANDTGQFKIFGKTWGINPFPSLNNTSDSLVLKNENDSVIFQVHYSDKWYRDDHKKSGGWSLEMIDPFTVCQNVTNWSAARDSSGGTPGKVNSIYNPNTDTNSLRIDTIWINHTLINIRFNKSLEETSAKNISFKVYDSTGTEINYILKIAHVDSPYYHLFEIYVQEIFKPGTYTIQTNPLYACNSNAFSVSAVFVINPQPVVHYPLIINEIFADPSPQVALPAAEFIELYNYSDSLVNMNGIMYSDPSTSYTFKNDSIFPHEHLIITSKEDSAGYSKYGRVIAIDPFPSLNNSFDILKLTHNENEIDQVSFSDQWYKDPDKKEGGWTLELIDPGARCKGVFNWAASIDSTGGTPGKVNSVYKTASDTAEFLLSKIEVIDSVTLRIYFSKILNIETANITDNYSLTPSSISIVNIQPEPPEYKTVLINLSAALTKGLLYTLKIKNIQDCNEDTLIETKLNFIDALTITSKDLLINEVLFNPKPDGVDFVEVYNNSSKIIDLGKLYIANTKDGDTLNMIKKISADQKLVFPGKYLLLSVNSDMVQQQYFTQDPGAFIQVAAMPSYNDDEGCVVLLRHDSLRIDQFHYNDDMHFALLEDPEGYSLERKKISATEPAANNWASASSTCGGATPGYKNSQADDSSNPENKNVIIDPGIFSPDNNGHDDYLHIYYHFTKSELKGSISIYNHEGILIRKLVKGELLGVSGEYVWDGLDERQQKSSTGIYIIYFEAFDIEGNTYKYKKPCVLVAF